MPSLQAKFPTCRAFAAARLEDIVSTKLLDAAQKLEVNTLESGTLINDGRAHFTFRPLPLLAQTAPAFGLVLTEVDGDGKADLCIAQNFFSPQRETGRMDGGVSLLARGRGDGSFDVVWSDRSGLVVPGDAKSLTTADVNGDGWPDLLFGVNNDALLAFENQGRKDASVLAVQLHGRPGNPTAVGARVTVRVQDLPPQTAEVHSGGGYLSQSSSTLLFGVGAVGSADQVEVLWPDGHITSHRPQQSARVLHLTP